MDDSGSNKLCTHLQQDHRNDKVDSSMAVISDLKQINKETLLHEQGVPNEKHTEHKIIMKKFDIFFYYQKRRPRVRSVRLNFCLFESGVCSTAADNQT